MNEEQQVAEQTASQGIKRLMELAEMPNIALDENFINKVGRDVVRFTKVDDDSREDWLKRSQDAMDLALQVVEEKTTPWPGAANVKYPLITVAALQFHARAYPAIVQGNNVVKPQITGADDEGLKARSGLRISQHMNYQLLEENPDWEPDMDRMLLALSIEGSEFKKSYFNAELGYNVSEWIRPEDFIVHDKTKSLLTCPRMTHRLWYYPHEIDDKMRSGIWSEVDLTISTDEYEEEVLQEFYEQHTYLDIDEDGYKEPYIVTVHKKSEKVVRVVAGYFTDDIVVEMNGVRGPLGELLFEAGRREVPVEELLGMARLVKVPRIEMFTHYEFIPNPTGSFYAVGFGQVVGPLSNSVDTTINQLLDAGTLANRQGGFIHDGVSIEGQRGAVSFQVGEFKRVKVPSSRSINDSIYQLRFPDPSLVLFNLLGTMIQAAKDVTSVQDIMSGGANPSGNRETATTTMIRVEQGMKVFSAIYKRIFRALKQEFKKLYKLNGKYLDPKYYFPVLDSRELEQIGLADYQGDGTDVQPVADPQLATSALAMAKSQALLQVMQHPLINDEEVLRRYFEGHEIPAPERLFVPPDQRQQPPPPDLVLKAQIAASEHTKRKSEIVANYARALRDIAKAESEEIGQQLQAYAQGLKSIIDGWSNGQEGMGGMAGVPPDQGGIQGAQGGAGADQEPGVGILGPV